MISIMLVDDQVSVRQGLKMRFALEPDLQVVAEAEDGETALALVHDVRPNVVLMDVVMSQMDGISATRSLRGIAPETAVVVLSLYGDPQTRKRALDAGATAFIDKHEDTQALVSIIRRAAVQAEPPTNDDESLRPKDEEKIGRVPDASGPGIPYNSVGRAS